MLSESATDNERGSPRYFAPEMAAWQPSGRAADIFSLGCVLLELVILHFTGSLEHVRQNRSNDPSYHANLHKIDTWLDIPDIRGTAWKDLLFSKIRVMLSKNPEDRPTAFTVLVSVVNFENGNQAKLKGRSLFDKCCKNALIPRGQYEEDISISERKNALLEAEIRSMKQKIHDQNRELISDAMTIEEHKLQQLVSSMKDETKKPHVLKTIEIST